MSERKISYLNRTFEEYKNALKELISRYYPQIANDFDDASIGSWLIDMIASIADNLSFHIDKTYNETCIDSAAETRSVYSIARTNGVKVPGAKASMAEVEFSCELPIVTSSKNDASTLGMPNWFYAPIIKRGTKMTSGNQIFENLNDVNFAEEFGENGNMDRTVIPIRDTNGNTVKYKITKKQVAVAGESRVYKQLISNGDIKPFMEITIPDENVMNIESIIFKDGSDYTINPTYAEFMMTEEFVPAEESKSNVDTYRFFEVDSLLEQYRWGDAINKEGNQSQPQNVTYNFGYYNEKENTIVPTYSITKGEWKPLTQKFITEFTDKGYLKVIFGSGEQIGQDVDISAAETFSKAQMTRMVRNNFLGRLPNGGWTMYILYRCGGGSASNVARGSINSFSNLIVDIGKNARTNDERTIVVAVKNSISVINTTPSVSGKDAPTVEEVKAMMRYHIGSQQRCVTIKDYEDRILQMPPKYGCPFRISVLEENNKIMIYMLGVDNDGHITETFPTALSSNIQDYLSMYRMVNDYVEIKSGKVINISFEIDVYVDKNYNASDVVTSIIEKVKNYMDVNMHQIGEDIFVGDIEKEISKTDGVLNLIDTRVFNETGNNYSPTRVTQQTIIEDGDTDYDRLEIDLEASDYILNTDADSMFEVKYPNTDIKVRVKTR